MKRIKPLRVVSGGEWEVGWEDVGEEKEIFTYYLCNCIVGMFYENGSTSYLSREGKTMKMIKRPVVAKGPVEGRDE